MTDEEQIKAHLEPYMIGISEAELPFSSSQEARIISSHMLQQAQRTVQIVSRDLDPKVYNHRDIQNALAKLVQTNNKAEIQILIHDPSKALQQNHYLINLYQKLDSYIAIKRIHEDYLSYNHAYMLIDDTAFTYREFADTYQGIANYKQRKQVKDLARTFATIWELSEVEYQFKTLNI